MLTACFASSGTEVDEGAGWLIDECIATPWTNTLDASEPFCADPSCVGNENNPALRTPPPEGLVRVFFNYPMRSPEYDLYDYGQYGLVRDDASMRARLDGDFLPDAVFGRAAGDDPWRPWQLLDDPDAMCPPMTSGEEWPRYP